MIIERMKSKKLKKKIYLKKKNFRSKLLKIIFQSNQEDQFQFQASIYKWIFNYDMIVMEIQNSMKIWKVENINLNIVKNYEEDPSKIYLKFFLL